MTSKNEPRGHWYSTTLKTLSVLWLAFMLFFLVCIGKFSLMSLFGSIPSVLFVAVPFILLLLMLSYKKTRASSLLALVGLAMGSTQFEVNLSPLPVSTLKPDEHLVSVINWNTLMWDEKKDQQAFFDFLTAQEADVYILQEVLYSASQHDPAMDNAINPDAIPITSVIDGLKLDYLTFDKTETIKTMFPGYYIAHHQQFLVLSRFPITQAKLDESDQYQVVDIDINGTPLRLFNVHVVLHLEFENPLKPYFYQALKRRFDARSIAFDRLLQDAQATESDYIIAGDFNSPPTMGTMDDLEKTHDDLFQYGNDIIPLTFEFNDMRLWRFDYVLANPDRGFNVLSFENFPIPMLSDHNAQRFDLAFRTNTKGL